MKRSNGYLLLLVLLLAVVASAVLCQMAACSRSQQALAQDFGQNLPDLPSDNAVLPQLHTVLPQNGSNVAADDIDGQATPQQNSKSEPTNSSKTKAKAAVVMEQSSGRVLFEQNCHLRLPMASTTKIATALTVINNCPNLDEVVQIPAEACGIEGSSLYLRAGEHLTVRELLLGLMLRSGNDCAVALALKVGGSVEGFAHLMNELASQLGCADTHFVTPHGLHDDEHFTSAYDLARITCAAFNSPTFAEIVATKSVKISNEGYDYPRVLTNKNKLLSTLDGADGVKTGYTKKAGRCLVGSATRNGMRVVAVVLDCGPMFEQTSQLLEEAFAKFSLQTVIPQNKLCGVVFNVGKPTFYQAQQAFCYPVTADEKPLLTTKIATDLSTISVCLAGEIVHTQPLVPLQ